MSISNNMEKVRGVLELVLENESRINQAKPIQYWYPLSQATYGVDEILEALDSMCTYRTSMAEKVLSFERQFSRYQNSLDSVMVNSGSSADLLLCLLLTNPLNPLLPADRREILIPAVTWPTQIWSALMAGLDVKLVDIDPKTLNIDLSDLESKITEKTGAIFLVHLMGNPCDMDTISHLANKHNLLIIEDCCEAMGAQYDGVNVGNFGIGGAYSFFFSHHITTMEGGMVSVNSAEHSEQLRILRAHGWIRNVDSTRFPLTDYLNIDPRYAFVNWGLNVRPTEVQAAFGLHQLIKVPNFSARRQLNSNRFNEFINKCPYFSTPYVSPKAQPSWLALPITVSIDAPFTRQQLTHYLEGVGVETRPLVTGNVANHPVAQLFPSVFLKHKFVGADFVHANSFYIGLSPVGSDSDIDRLIGLFDNFLKRY